LIRSRTDNPTEEGFCGRNFLLDLKTGYFSRNVFLISTKSPKINNLKFPFSKIFFFFFQSRNSHRSLSGCPVAYADKINKRQQQKSLKGTPERGSSSEPSTSLINNKNGRKHSFSLIKNKEGGENFEKEDNIKQQQPVDLPFNLQQRKLQINEQIG